MRPLLLLLALSSSFSAPSSAQPHDHHSPTTHGASHSVLGGELLLDLEKLGGKPFDRAFLSLMIAHHEAALEMSQLTLSTSKDARVRAWANEVVLGQTGEVREMRAMLGDFNLTLDEQLYTLMAADMKMMVDDVRATQQRDDAWVSGMAHHHGLGVVMATLALTNSDNLLVQMLARNIVVLQARQLAEYRTWQPNS